MCGKEAGSGDKVGAVMVFFVFRALLLLTLLSQKVLSFVPISSIAKSYGIREQKWYISSYETQTTDRSGILWCMGDFVEDSSEDAYSKKKKAAFNLNVGVHFKLLFPVCMSHANTF